jgi:hypothetical protein
MNYKTAVNTFQVFTFEQVRKINKEIKKNILQTENLSNASQNVSKIGKFSHVSCGPLMELLHPWLYRCQESNRTIFGYDIDWYFHLDALNYNVYGTGGKYGWHIDMSDRNVTVNDTKLTCLLNLSEEPYEGGKFYVTHIDEEQKFTSGMGLVFTSLIAHKVTPVTKGERITLTYWANGPLWR